MKNTFGIASLLVVIILVVIKFQTSPPVQMVTIYTSVDQVYSEPILQAFEKQTGIKVNALYDTEAAKTVGLVNRLIAEKTAPLADVFWNGEFIQTLVLKEQGVLAPYAAPASAGLAAQFIDPDGFWAGFGGRARVILVNTDMLARQDWPTKLFDLVGRADEVTFANPLFGSTATHSAALAATIGLDEAVQFFDDLRVGGARMVDGNSVVRDLVAQGQVPLGLSDTDDACVAIKRGANMAVVFPDQQNGGIGTLVISNTVAVIKGAPHPDAARMLADYLLSPITESALIKSGWVQIPSRPDLAQPTCFGDIQVRAMAVAMSSIHAAVKETGPRLRALFQK